MLERAAVKQGTKVTFVLPEDGDGDRPVSVVGDFNDWKPGAHVLKPREDGSRAVSVVLPKGRMTAFRYLAGGGHWFDEGDADHHDGTNGYVHT
ncbi:isoamylase early set domain-containing protein [Streptacidiphilus rugosus]|uniref:isoamylase early set domain-containing protein n=1 Tax=Streptacidiphilus rugosus TaxID=405783 RepID=UPI000564B006|nr:isoamylase early set domain-containing protein [Streptacidiphilus rugosus]